MAAARGAAATTAATGSIRLWYQDPVGVRIPGRAEQTRSRLVNTQQVDPDVDVLIVGAGASGGVAALELAGRGLRVVCLEQGGWHLPDDFTGGKPEWELTALKQWNSSPNVRQNPADYPVDSTESPVEPLMFNGVGGSTIMFAGHWVRALPSDFRVKTLDGVAEDWPFTYEDLRPFYHEVTHHIGASGLEGDPAYPDRHTFPLPPLPIGKYGLIAAKGMDKLGWHWWPAPNAIASRNFKNRPACLRYGACESGCPTGAKASTDLTHWRDAIALGAVLVTGVRVRQLTVDKRGMVTGAEYVDRGGMVHHQVARVTVLAANGIGTPRLLLNSTCPLFPQGLANSTGAGGQAADDASVCLGVRRLRRRARDVAGPQRAGVAVVAVLRDRHRPRLRARGEVEPDADRRPALPHPVGARPGLAGVLRAGISQPAEAHLWALHRMGDYHRRPARGAHRGGARPECH